jgi:hypothetical protein
MEGGMVVVDGGMVVVEGGMVVVDGSMVVVDGAVLAVGGMLVVDAATVVVEAGTLVVEAAAGRVDDGVNEPCSLGLQPATTRIAAQMNVKMAAPKRGLSRLFCRMGHQSSRWDQGSRARLPAFETAYVLSGS